MKIFVNFNFSDFEPLFRLFRGLCAKCPFYKTKSILREDFFETNLDLRKHPEQVFWIFFSFFKYIYSIFVFICVIGELRELCAKFWNFWIKIHREKNCQSWPLFTQFYSGPIVQSHSLIAPRCYIHLRWRFNLIYIEPYLFIPP